MTTLINTKSNYDENVTIEKDRNMTIKSDKQCVTEDVSNKRNTEMVLPKSVELNNPDAVNNQDTIPHDRLNTLAATYDNPNILWDDSPVTIANEWLRRGKVLAGGLTLRWYRDKFYEYANGRYLVVENNEHLLYKISDFLKDKFYILDGGEIKRIYQTDTLLKQTLNVCKDLCRINDEAPVWLGDNKDKPNPRMSLAFRNGILDLDKYIKGEIVLYPSTPNFFTMNALPYNFDPTAESGLWNNYLKDVFRGNQKKIQLLSEWMGYNCVPNISHSNLMLFVGPMASGKTTVANTMAAMLGDYPACGTADLFDLFSDRLGFYPVMNALSIFDDKLFVVPKKHDGLGISNMLRVMNGEKVTVHRKYKSPLSTVQLYCRFTITAYNVSFFDKHTHTILDRANILTFPNSYAGRENRMLKGQLKAEAEAGGLINFALRGLKSLCQNKKFTTLDKTDIPPEIFETQPTPEKLSLTEFVNERLEKGAGHYELKDTLFLAWYHFCEGRKVHPGFKNGFIRQLHRIVPEIKICRRRIGGKQVHTITGLKLRDDIKQGLALTSIALKVIG